MLFWTTLQVQVVYKQLAVCQCFFQTDNKQLDFLLVSQLEPTCFMSISLNGEGFQNPGRRPHWLLTYGIL